MTANLTFDPYDPCLVGLLFCNANTMRSPANQNDIPANDNVKRGA